MRIPSGTTDQYIYFVAVDATDFAARETGLTTFTVYRSRNGGTATAMTTPTINETSSANMPGVYELLLDEDMTIGAGNDSEEMVFHITATGMAPVTRTIELYRPKITAGNTLDVTATGAAGIDWGNVENQSTAVDLSSTDISLCDTVTTLTGHTPQTGDSFARIGLAGASLTNLGGSGNNWNTTTPPTVAAIADGVWDEAVAGHVGAGTFGATDAAILADTNELQTNQGNWLTATGFATPTDVTNAAANVSVDEIQATALADLFNTNSATTYASAVAGSVVKEIADNAGGSALTLADIADAVWDEELTVGHTTADSAGAKLNAAGGAADPWATVLPGAYGVGTAGKIIGDNINAPLATIDTVVDTINSNIGTAGLGLTNLGGSGNNWNTTTPPTVAAISADVWAAATRTLTADTNLNIPTAIENADALLNRDMSAVSDTVARSPLNALRFLRNKWSVSGTTLTVTKEDDTTAGWTATVTTDATADPITGNDPA